MDPTPDGRTPAQQEPADRTRTLLFALVAVLAVAVVGLTAVLVVCGDDAGLTPGSQPSPTPTSVTSTSPAPTSESASTPPTTGTAPAAISAAEAGTVVWPRPGTGTVYDEPADAARGMATGLAGFTDPLVGAFRQGDSRSGEVDIRPKDTGPATTVLVRQMSDGHWYAIGASSDDLQLSSPDAGTAVSSPVTVRGRSRAFEGTIIVTVLAQGDPTALGREPLIGGGGELGPFSGTVRFDAPDDATTGAIMLTTDSAEDGRIWQATVVPVQLAKG
jgi:hypothetical protein